MATTVRERRDTRANQAPERRVEGGRPEHPAHIAGECYVEAICAVTCDYETMEHAAYAVIALAREQDRFARGMSPIALPACDMPEEHPVRAALQKFLTEIQRVTDTTQALSIMARVSAGIAAELHRRARRVRDVSLPEIRRGYEAAEQIIAARIPLSAFLGGESA